MADGTRPNRWRNRLRTRWQVKWVVTVAGAVAMATIAGILVWNVIAAQNPLAELLPGFARTAEHRPVASR